MHKGYVAVSGAVVIAVVMLSAVLAMSFRSARQLAGGQLVEKTAVSPSSGIFTKTQTVGQSATFGVALADVDGDGDLDAFTANALHEAAPDNANKVWLNNGNGRFTDSGQSLGNQNSYAVALGDLDGDGHSDAFVGNSGANTVWLNDGVGIFNDSGQRLGSADSYTVVLGDVDGDDDLDAYVANEGENNALWLNDGAGQFTRSGQAFGNPDSYSAALGDLDGDGDLDVYVTNYTPAAANQVWLNDGDGNFTDTGQRLGSAPSYTPVLGDFDGDGDLDVYVANANTDELWINTGAGVFSESSQSLDVNSGFGAAAGDLEGDGDLDLFLPTYSGENGIHLWFNDGSGQLSDHVPILKEDAANYDVALGDLDGNGTLDAFVANLFFEQGNSVWINQDEPVVALVAEHSSPTIAGWPVTFTATLTGGTNVALQWHFGDGGSGLGSVVQHVYDDPGTYTIVVTATNNVATLTSTTTVRILEPWRNYLPFILAETEDSIRVVSNWERGW